MRTAANRYNPYQEHLADLSEHPLRKRALQVAQEWLGTPFHHLQRCKGAGVDCGQFLLGVFHEAGLIPYVKTPYYTKDFHLHRAEEWYRGIVEQFSRPITVDELEPADLVLYRVGRVFSHGGIVLVWPKIIHSFVTDGVTYTNGNSGHLLDKHHVFYRPLMFETMQPFAGSEDHKEAAQEGVVAR